jgi:vacuolar iron transporter family protein
MDSAVAERRRRASGVESGAVRAAILGINDGLVTNVALILGVVGAAADPSVVRLAGTASLVAGACSMAVGEYVSMRAQVELLTRVLDDARAAIRENPARERATLEDTLLGRGYDPETASAVGAQFARGPDQAIALYARAVLGLNEKELGSPWASAVSSFLMFAVGASVPLLPWLFWTGDRAAFVSLGAVMAASGVIGAMLGRFSGRNMAFTAGRQILCVCMAAGTTYLIGKLFGATVG